MLGNGLVREGGREDGEGERKGRRGNMGETPAVFPGDLHGETQLSFSLKSPPFPALSPPFFHHYTRLLKML